MAWFLCLAAALMLLSPLSAGVARAQGGATAAPVGDGSAAAAWAALSEGGGVVVLMRHAIAPGTGDPPQFRLDDCATQRNLSPAGRTQAQRIGDSVRQRGIAVAAVYSSQWCRCLETARLLDVAEVQAQPLLNSTFAQPEAHAAQMAGLRRWLAELRPTLPVILVTHQVVITGLTGVFPGSGEMVVLRVDGDGLQVVGRIAPPAG
jgi:broad specificity phosphatase PhoE